MGVRDKYSILLQDKEFILKLAAFGMQRKRAFSLQHTNQLPSLREALAIDCCSNGSISVYSWVDTELMHDTAQMAVASEADKLFNPPNWPAYIASKERKILTERMVRKLSSTQHNAYRAVKLVGLNKIVREYRRKLLSQINRPCSVEEEATDEEIDRALRRRERLIARRRALLKDQRQGE